MRRFLSLAITPPLRYCPSAYVDELAIEDIPLTADMSRYAELIDYFRQIIFLSASVFSLSFICTPADISPAVRY